MSFSSKDIKNLKLKNNRAFKIEFKVSYDFIKAIGLISVLSPIVYFIGIAVSMFLAL